MSTGERVSWGLWLGLVGAMGVVGCSSGSEKKPGDGDGRPNPVGTSSGSPIVLTGDEAGLRAAMDQLVKASLAGEGMTEAHALTIGSSVPYGELETLFGYYRRDADVDYARIDKELTELPARLRDLASGGELTIEVRSLATGTNTPRQRTARAELQPAAKGSMFSVRFTRKEGPASGGAPQVVLLEHVAWMDKGFRYLGPLRRGQSLDCAAEAARREAGCDLSKVADNCKPAAPSLDGAAQEKSGAEAVAKVAEHVRGLGWSDDQLFIVTDEGFDVFDPEWPAPPRALPFWSDWRYCATAVNGPVAPDALPFGSIQFGASGTYGPDPQALMLGPDGSARLLYRAGFYPQERLREIGVTAAAIAPTGRFAMAKTDGTVCTGEESYCNTNERSADPSAKRITALAFSADGDRLAGIASDSTSLFVWAKGAASAELALPGKGFDEVAWSSGSEWLALAGPAGLVAVAASSTAPSRSPIEELKKSPRPDVRKVAIETTGAMITVTKAGDVEWIADPRELAGKKLGSIGEAPVALSVGDRKVAVAGASGHVFVFALPDAPAPTKVDPPKRDSMVVTENGEHLYLQGYEVSGVGAPSIPFNGLRRRLLGMPEPRLTLLGKFSEAGEKRLRALAAETHAQIDTAEQKPGIE